MDTIVLAIAICAVLLFAAIGFGLTLAWSEDALRRWNERRHEYERRRARGEC